MQATEADRRRTELWESVDDLLERATIPGILAHELGPLAAHRLRRLGEAVPKPLVLEERAASLSMLTGIPLIERVRENSDGPLLVIKGPEIAKRYPGNARRFGDIDLLMDRADVVQRALIDVGFVEVEVPEFEITPEHHHLQPLQWPTIWLKVELHKSPYLLASAPDPPIDEILEARVASALQIEGVFAPDPVHHALILTAHAWTHEPLHTLRDLVDIAIVATSVDENELLRTAQAWGMARVWRTTQRAIEAIFHGGQRSAPLRSWARHLALVRERSVFEDHVERLFNAYWAEPPHRASVEFVRALHATLLPLPGESWGDKLRRVRHAIRNPSAPVPRRHLRRRAQSDGRSSHGA